MAADRRIETRSSTRRCPQCGSAVDRLAVVEGTGDDAAVTAQWSACSSTSCDWTEALE